VQFPPKTFTNTGEKTMKAHSLIDFTGNPPIIALLTEGNALFFLQIFFGECIAKISTRG